MAFFSFLSWFRPWWKTTETDYETVLARLSKDIGNVQARLVRVNQRERRASVTLTLYAILLWLAYAVFLYFTTADRRPYMTKGQRLQLWLPVVVGLLVILSVRSVVRWWFKRVSDGEEKHLRSLQRARRKKIDEIKQATRYDHLRSLLEKYDDTGRPGMRRGPSSVSTGLSKAGQKSSAVGQGATAAQPGTNPRQFQGKRDGLPVPSGNAGAVSALGVTQPTQPTAAEGAAPQPNGNNGAAVVPTIVAPAPVGQQLPFETPQQHLRFQKTWLDRVADKILGAESSSQDLAAEQRYALICHVCFSHNGLCPKEDWEEVQYICPRCGTFNSRRPSSVPVTSPWSSRNMSTRASFGAGGLSPSPSRLGFADMSPSVSLRSLPRDESNGSSFGGDHSADDSMLDRGGHSRRRASASDKAAGDDEDDDGGSGAEEILKGLREEALRRGGRSTGRKAYAVEDLAADDTPSLRKRQAATGDLSAEPMQVDD